MSQTKQKTVQLTQLALLMALLAVLAFTPLGFIQIPPVAITLMHIPVIIGAIVLGPTCGGILGLAFGLFSMIKASTTGVSPVDLAFSPLASGAPLQSIIMAVGPRVLLGVIAGSLYKFFSTRLNNDAVSVAAAAGLATLSHTVLVLGCLALFFSELGVSFMAIVMTIVSLNGILELAAGMIIAVAVAKPLRRYNVNHVPKA